MQPATSYVDLLIVGAGPSGLTAASWAAQYDMSTKIIDKKGRRTSSGHADGIQSRTLEILDSFGIVDPILKHGVGDVDMCYWVPGKETGSLERLKRDRSDPGRMSRFGQTLLNQGVVEQAFLEYLDVSQNVHVEWRKRAESLHIDESSVDDDRKDYPIVVGVGRVAENGKTNSQEAPETIYARYLIASDGAHSWARHQLDVPTEATPEDSTWGVVDIIPITNFPDIRQACSIQSEHYGSIMTVPRENRLVRFYIHLQGELKEKALRESRRSPRALVDMAAKIMEPFNLTYRHCDWWSLYTTGRSIIGQYRPHERVFIAGDAAHTHTPKGGQGMNISIQDTYNLVWKLGSVIADGADPIILDTYDTERRPVAKELLTLDSQLVWAYEASENDTTDAVYEIREHFARFMAGTDVTYPPSILVADGGNQDDSNLARNIKLGMRLPSFPVVFLCDGISTHLARRLSSDGSWRLLVFPGDLRQPQRMNALAGFADFFSKRSHIAHLREKQAPRIRYPDIEALLIQSNPRDTTYLLDLPEIFHPFDEVLGWDYWKTFADDSGEAYKGYGIDEEAPGCLVLCRPDQHVAWVGGLENMAGVDNYFAVFSRPMA